jgi:hypothetical protein
MSTPTSLEGKDNCEADLWVDLSTTVNELLGFNFVNGTEQTCELSSKPEGTAWVGCDRKKEVNHNTASLSE